MSVSARKENHVQKSIASIGIASVEFRRARGLEVSEAHNTTHLQNVDELGAFVADIYNFSEQEKNLTHACTWLHDLIRSPSEDPNVPDSQASAYEAKRMLTELSRNGTFITTSEERDAVGYAIERHGSAPPWLDDENATPDNLRDKLWLALFVGDKLEANGVRVIARRSSFVAGDRLRDEKGDWRDFGFLPNRDESLVVAIESMLRLTFINPEGNYPYRLMPIVHPLYDSQREFVNGVLKGLGLTIEDVSRMLLETKDTSGKTILEARKVQSPRNQQELTLLLSKKSGISNESIVRVRDDQAQSALETITYFSSNYKENLDALVEKWKPRGLTARRWKTALIEYANGEWLLKQKEQYRYRTLLEQYTPHEEGLMPLFMGPPYRVPDYAYPAWGISSMDENIVVDLYKAEWALGNEGQLDFVSQATKEAGFGDYPELLRRAAAVEIARIIASKQSGERIRILDIGAGPGLSALTVFEAIPEKLRQSTEFTLIDPSHDSKAAAEKLLRNRGVRFTYLSGTDVEVLPKLMNSTYDIVLGVASVHHHSRIPFEQYFSKLIPGGHAVFADWHNSIWEHPSRVKRFLSQFNWVAKNEGLGHWSDIYPNATIPVRESVNVADQQANKQIIEFWKAYMRLTQKQRDVGTNAIWPLEGHRPVEHYVTDMKNAGFSVEEPKQLLPDSRLLMLTVGQKSL